MPARYFGALAQAEQSSQKINEFGAGKSDSGLFSN
jgi:hypothetical protein